MKLAIVIPVYNEENSIINVIESIPSEIDNITDIKIFVVDDGSTDKTRDFLKQLSVCVISHSKNRGLGRAFKNGIETAIEWGADIIVNMDGDGQFSGKAIKDIINPVITGDAHFCTASRFIDPDITPDMPWIKHYGNKIMSLLVYYITTKKYYDVTCGFRAYSREAFLRLNVFSQFTYTHESFIELAAKGMEIAEIPVEVHSRVGGQSKISRSVINYTSRVLCILFNSLLSFAPHKLFNPVSILFFIPGFSLITFLFAHYMAEGQFSPHIWSGFVGGTLIAISILTWITGLIAKILVRMRLNQEELLYLTKKQHSYDKIHTAIIGD